MYPDADLDASELGAGDEDMTQFSAERLERYAFDKSARYWEGWGGDEYGEQGLRSYWLHECFLKTDYDGDGIT